MGGLAELERGRVSQGIAELLRECRAHLLEITLERLMGTGEVNDVSVGIEPDMSRVDQDDPRAGEVEVEEQPEDG